MITVDLFTSEKEVPAPAKAPDSAFLVTNHLNLMYMLAAGLVMPPAGFGDKYYRDPLECFPGWIPIFLDKAPKGAIESATREAGHLRPVVVRIGLAGIAGGAIAFGERGPRELRSPDGLEGTDTLVLLPAPLPTSRIEAIVFRSADDKRACEREAKDFGNVPLEAFARRTDRRLFARAPDRAWPPGDGPAGRAVPLERPLAAGGAMAMLLLFGNLGDAAVHACRDAFDPAEDLGPSSDGHPVLAGLAAWMQPGGAQRPAPTAPTAPGTVNVLQGWLFWEAVERLVQWRDSGRAGSAENELLDLLATASERLDPRAQAGIRKLHGTLESLTGLADASASELFQRHDTPLAHALTLFFLRRDCADLVEYRSDRLMETDWLAAAILFGVRDGWLGLPLRLRAHPGLANAVSHRMARMSHRLAASDLDLGDPPARVRPLRELFADGSAWRADARAAALELARSEKWDCVFTRVRLAAGEYTLTVKGGSMSIDLPGEPRISPEIDRARFFALLAGARLDGRAEEKVRAKLRD